MASCTSAAREPCSPSARNSFWLIVLRLLDATSEAQLTEARALLASLRDTLVEFGIARADREALATSIRQLDELFLIVVVGEFNAGKSAFINALLGDTVLAEGVTPTTAQIQ